MLPIRLVSLQWAIGAYCFLIGALMFVAPHQFDAPTFDALRQLLRLWGVLFLLTGTGLVVASTLVVSRVVPILAHLTGGVALLALAYGFAATGSWTGLVVYAVLGL